MYYLSTADIWSYNYKPKDSATYENIHTKAITVNNKAMNLFRFLIYFPCLFNSTFNLFEATQLIIFMHHFVLWHLLKVCCTLVYSSTLYEGTLADMNNIINKIYISIYYINCYWFHVNRFILQYIFRCHWLLILNYN